MSEFKRYGMSGFGGGLIEIDDGPFFAAEDFDAQRLRADTAEGALQIANETLAKFADDLAAAEQRIAKLTELLGELDENWNSHDGRERFSLAMRKVEAALNPNPEAESHETQP